MREFQNLYLERYFNYGLFDFLLLKTDLLSINRDIDKHFQAYITFFIVLQKWYIDTLINRHDNW